MCVSVLWTVLCVFPVTHVDYWIVFLNVMCRCHSVCSSVRCIPLLQVKSSVYWNSSSPRSWLPECCERMLQFQNLNICQIWLWAMFLYKINTLKEIILECYIDCMILLYKHVSAIPIMWCLQLQICIKAGKLWHIQVKYYLKIQKIKKNLCITQSA